MRKLYGQGEFSDGLTDVIGMYKQFCESEAVSMAFLTLALSPSSDE